MLEIANKVREKRAINNKWFLYNYISKNPGLTIYKLSKLLKWSVGKVNYYIKGLLEDGMITNLTEIVNNRVKRSFYSKKVTDFINWNEMTNLKKLK